MALGMLKRRDCHSAEVEIRLSERGYPKETVDTVLKFLWDHKFLNNQETIQKTVDRASGKRAAGRNKLRAQMMARGIPEEEIDRVLDSRTEDQDIQAMRDALSSRQNFAGDKAKAFRFLVSRGFEPELIEGHLDRLLEPV